MPLSEAVGLAEFAVSKGVSRLIISGGEAVMHPGFAQLSTCLKTIKRQMKIVIQSNGLIGDVDIDLVRAFDIVHLSFEPDESEVRRGSVEKTVVIARKFLDAGIYTYFFATIHPGNIDKIDWMVDVANRSGINIGFNLCIAGHREQLQLSAEQKKSAIRKLYLLHLEGRILRFTSPAVAVLREQQSDRYVGIRGGCTAGIAACVVLANGDVVPCPFLRVKAGNIRETGLEKIWFGSRVFASLRNRPLFDDPCGSCQHLSYCGGCRVVALNHTGRLNGFDPDCILK
jgi:AdoMet-dependent heme synthase